MNVGRVLSRPFLTTSLAAGILLAGLVPAAADGLGDFLSDGSLLFNARYRYEGVHQKGFAKDAEAHTVRLRAGYQTATVWHLQALIEVEGTGHLSDTFNDTVNGHMAYPVVPDPENLELNRLQILYSGLPDTKLLLGRQEINLDDQRFVGGVAFRQNEQTFDAVRIDNGTVPGLTLTYIYLDRVNRVFGERSSQGHFGGDVHLMNATYDLKPFGKLTAYAYLLALDSAPALSTQTYGGSLSGQQAIGDDVSLTYRAEAATQHPYADNKAHFDLAYLRGELGLTSGIWSAQGGVEYLEGNGTTGFSTPLATLHKFQGFADVFLTTPPSGITDAYGKIGVAKKDLTFGPITGASLTGWYHDFSNPRGGSLGSEFDIEAALHLGAHVTTSLTYATYDGVPGYASRDKVWLAIDVTN